MVDEVSDRVSDWLPADITDRNEIESAVRDSGFSQHWDPAVTDAVADSVSKRRDPDTSMIERETTRQTTVVGPTDDRQAATRAADGTILGEPDNVETWEDQWGNIMGRNTETGTTKKVTDKDDR